MVQKLEAAANIAIIATCIAVLSTLAFRFWSTTHPRGRLPDARALQAGDPLPRIDGIPWKDADRTLLMVLRENCRYCAESMPFYQRLSKAVQNGQSRRVQLVVVALDPADAAREYLDRHNLKVAGVFPASPRQREELRIPGTPTLILVDHSGLVKHVWLGKLDSNREAEVVAALFPKT